MDETPAQEKRAIRRFALQLPVTLTSAPVGEVTVETKDVSSHGICFYCETAIEREANIEFTVTLPSEFTTAQPISVHCRGKVVRVDREADGKYAVAAAIDSYEFIADEDKVSVGTPAVTDTTPVV